MSYTIAVCGKGGVGKTTVAGLLVRALQQHHLKPILAVDADPNSCLDALLGVSVESTIGGVREDARELAGKGMSSGVSKQQLLEMKIEQSLVEAEDFDLIAMGRPEGPGCYCYANNVLKNALAKLTSQYPYVVLDNEAGLENLSRRIIQQVNLLVMVSDSSKRGLETVLRLYQLSREMGIEAERRVLIVNRLRHLELPPMAKDVACQIDADDLLGLSDDEELGACADEGQPLSRLSDQNRIFAQLSSFIVNQINSVATSEA